MRLFAEWSDATYFWWTIASFFASALFFLFCFAVWGFQGAGEALIDRVTAFSAVSLCAAIFNAIKALSTSRRVVLLAIINCSSMMVFFAVWAVWSRGNVHPVVSIVYVVEIYLAISRYRELGTLDRALLAHKLSLEGSHRLGHDNQKRKYESEQKQIPFGNDN